MFRIYYFLFMMPEANGNNEKWGGPGEPWYSLGGVEESGGFRSEEWGDVPGSLELLATEIEKLPMVDSVKLPGESVVRRGDKVQFKDFDDDWTEGVAEVVDIRVDRERDPFEFYVRVKSATFDGWRYFEKIRVPESVTGEPTINEMSEESLRAVEELLGRAEGEGVVKPGDSVQFRPVLDGDWIEGEVLEIIPGVEAVKGEKKTVYKIEDESGDTHLVERENVRKVLSLGGERAA